MRSNCNTSWKFFTILTSVVFLMHLLASMTLGNNEIYRLGVSFGENLRERDDDLDPKDLDSELQELTEQMGTVPEASKLFESDEFVDGIAFGYYTKSELGQS